MAESTSFVAMPKMIDGTLSGAGNLQVIVPFHGRHAMSLVETFNDDATHTLVATPQLWISNDYKDPGNGDPVGIAAAEARAHWTLVTDPAIVTFLTTDGAASPPGGKPNGVAGDAALQIDPLRCAAFRWRVTWVSGNGHYQLDGEAE